MILIIVTLIAFFFSVFLFRLMDALNMINMDANIDFSATFFLHHVMFREVAYFLFSERDENETVKMNDS